MTTFVLTGVKVLMSFVGLCFFLLGVATLILDSGSIVVGGLPLVFGAFLMASVVLSERQRHKEELDDAAEPSGAWLHENRVNPANGLPIIEGTSADINGNAMGVSGNQPF